MLLSSEFKQGANKTALRLSKFHHSFYLVANVLQKSFFVPYRSPADSVRNLGNDIIANFKSDKRLQHGIGATPTLNSTGAAQTALGHLETSQQLHHWDKYVSLNQL
jgi:hypothetical protein